MLLLPAVLLAAATTTVCASASGNAHSHLQHAHFHNTSYPSVATNGTAHPAFPWPPSNSSAHPVQCRRVQAHFPPGVAANQTHRANAVRDLYRAEWQRYNASCFGHDEFDIITGKCINDFFGWGATIVDAIDTAIIMNLTDIVAQELEFIANADFTKSSSLVDGFDAIMRYVAGLLAAHDLIHSNLVPNGTYNEAHVKTLLPQALNIAKIIRVQFDTPTGLPAGNVNLTSQTPSSSAWTSPFDNKTYYTVTTAPVGTIILEYRRLTDLSGDPLWRSLADRAESYLVNPFPEPKYPGLVGSTVDVNTGNFLTRDYCWCAGIDSFFEYLIKTFQYNPYDVITQFYAHFWTTALDSTIKNGVATHPYHKPDLTFITIADQYGVPEWSMDDYSCFAGGNYLLGGAYLQKQEYIDLGLAVTDSCHATYNNTKTGLGPLGWAWYNGTNQAYDSSADNSTTDRKQADKWGYYVTAPSYSSFPESLESVLYAWRITGDPKWREYNWDIFKAIANSHNASFPYAGVTNVNQPGSFTGTIDSFFFGEVLKYLYLTFTDPSVVSLDEYTFNTEAHPLRQKRPFCS